MTVFTLRYARRCRHAATRITLFAYCSAAEFFAEHIIYQRRESDIIACLYCFIYRFIFAAAYAALDFAAASFSLMPSAAADMFFFTPLLFHAAYFFIAAVSLVYC